MPDEPFVPVSAFATTTKILLGMIHDLTIAMQVQRVALMNLKAEDLPVRAEYFQGLEPGIRKLPELQRVGEAILSMTTKEEIDELLKKLEGLS
jgi:hypothetical protein